MDNSPFGRLPAELRIKIFEFAMPLPEDKFIVGSFGDGGLFNKHSLSINNRGALMDVCKQFREESMAIFYSFDQLNVRAHFVLQDMEGDRLTGKPARMEQHIYPRFKRDVDAFLRFLDVECGGGKRYIDHVRICFGMWKIHRAHQAAFLNNWLSYDVARIIEYFKGTGVEVYVSFSHVDYLETHRCYIADLHLPIWDANLARTHIENWIEDQPRLLQGFQTRKFPLFIALCRSRLHDFVESVEKQSDKVVSSTRGID